MITLGDSLFDYSEFQEEKKIGENHQIEEEHSP